MTLGSGFIWDAHGFCGAWGDDDFWDGIGRGGALPRDVGGDAFLEEIDAARRVGALALHLLADRGYDLLFGPVGEPERHTLHSPTPAVGFEIVLRFLAHLFRDLFSDPVTGASLPCGDAVCAGSRSIIILMSFSLSLSSQGIAGGLLGHRLSIG